MSAQQVMDDVRKSTAYRLGLAVGTVEALLENYSDDHEWAQFAREHLEHLLHRMKGCESFRSDCDECVRVLNAALGRTPRG